MVVCVGVGVNGGDGFVGSVVWVGVGVVVMDVGVGVDVSLLMMLMVMGGIVE